MIDIESFTVWTLLALLILFAVMGGFIYASGMNSNNLSHTMFAFETKFKSIGFEIAQGEIHSPAIIEITRNYGTFTDFCHNNNMTKIYKVSEYSFAVISNESYGLEYRLEYHSYIWWTW